MPFVFRQIKLMAANHPIEYKVFYLESRSSISYLLAARKRLRALIKDFQADVVHAHYGSVNGLFAALSTTKPLVITYHGSDLNKTPSDGILSDFMARAFSNITALYSARIIVVSEKLRNRLWWKKNKAEVIPMGTDTAEFFPMAKQEAIKGLPNTYQFPYPTIVFNANNPKIKRLDLAEKAIELLKAEYPQAHLFKMSGDVPAEKIPLVLNASDALLLCSDKEGSPTIIKEAMACNLPIVSTDVGDVKDRISGVYEASIVVQNEKGICRGLSKILKLEKQKYNGREVLLAKKLDEASLQDKVFKIYKDC